LEIFERLPATFAAIPYVYDAPIVPVNSRCWTIFPVLTSSSLTAVGPLDCPPPPKDGLAAPFSDGEKILNATAMTRATTMIEINSFVFIV
jgi:hypothetical protein